MQLIINRAEAALAVATYIVSRRIARRGWRNKGERKTYREWHNYHKIRIMKSDELKELIEIRVKDDVKQSMRYISNTIKNERVKCKNWVLQNWSNIINKFGDGDEKQGAKKILQFVERYKVQSWVKSFGLNVDPNATFKLIEENPNVERDCVIRNIIDNEKFLKSKLVNQFPFWFIDTGYTNFISRGKKGWHRIVRNHVHEGPSNHIWPADRLGMFEVFPVPWRKSKNGQIWVLPPSPYVMDLENNKPKRWLTQTLIQLKKLTDRETIVREKANTKVRKSLYLDLLEHDVYCVVCHSSTAAIESIWAGVPVINTGQHISNQVTKGRVNDINHLYTGEIGNWLCRLSYSQFRTEEIFDGTAWNIIKEYHDV